jgi:hypothetical protein
MDASQFFTVSKMNGGDKPVDGLKIKTMIETAKQIASGAPSSAQPWAAMRQCYEQRPDLRLYAAALLVCTMEGIKEPPSDAMVRSRARREGWKKQTNRSQITEQTDLEFENIKESAPTKETLLGIEPNAEVIAGERKSVLERHRRDFQILNGQLNRVLAIFVANALMKKGMEVAANSNNTKREADLIRIMREMASSKIQLMHAERVIWNLDSESDAESVLAYPDTTVLDEIYEKAMKRAERQKIEMTECRNGFLDEPN